jgi:malyl-CoA/(S)-citramalyl-CoA lyase
MRNPKDFFKPMAIGAPEPAREIPFRPSRMIHFFDPSNPKMAAKAPSIAEKCDVLLGNLEDAIQADNKIAAREGFIKIAKENDFGDCQLWTRVNSLDSPWFLDDVTQIVEQVGNKVDVIMIPKVEGPWDIHFVDRLLAQLEARGGVKRPILVHAILETALGVANVEEIAGASPRMQGLSLGPADLAASRRMKTTRVGGGHPGYLVREDPNPDDAEAPRATAQQDLWRSATSETRWHAKTSFETRSSSDAWVRGRSTRCRSTSRRKCSAHRWTRCSGPNASSKRWAMVPAP